MFEVQFGRHPFATHLKPQVMEALIKKYPITFPEVSTETPAVSDDFKELVTELLSKDPNQRIGSDSCEIEILNHAFFKN